MEKENMLAPGLRLGRLELLEEAPKRNRRRYWRCRCDCGRECVVEAGHLRRGHSRSCGCLRREEMKARAVDLKGLRFGRLTAIEPTERRRKSSVIWRCLCDCGEEIFCESDALLRGHTRSCGCLREDQRKENMEKAIHFVDGTCIEKIAHPREIASNTSGHRGVTRLKNGHWRASITFRGRRYNLGTHRSFEAAVEARRRGEELYFSEFLEQYYAANPAKNSKRILRAQAPEAVIETGGQWQ